MGLWTQIFAVFFFILVGFLWSTNAAFRYRVKFVTYYSIVLVTAVFVIIIGGLTRGRDVRNFGNVRDFWNVVFRIFGVTPIVRDRHHVTSDKPYVLVSNHQSSFDLVGMMKVLPDRCSALGKKELLYAGTFGLGALICGLVFIDRLNRDKARGTMERVAQLLHTDNIKMWIFPEGTRNLARGLLPFKKGAFHLAIQAQVPVVPVVFSTYEHFMSKKPKILNTGRFLITCLPPIPTTGMTSEDCESLSEKVYNQMLEAYNKSSLEIQAAEKAAGRTLLKEY